MITDHVTRISDDIEHSYLMMLTVASKPKPYRDQLEDILTATQLAVRAKLTSRPSQASGSRRDTCTTLASGDHDDPGSITFELG
jgi:hypothetical protein